PQPRVSECPAAPGSGRPCNDTRPARAPAPPSSEKSPHAAPAMASIASDAIRTSTLPKSNESFAAAPSTSARTPNCARDQQAPEIPAPNAVSEGTPRAIAAAPSVHSEGARGTTGAGATGSAAAGGGAGGGGGGAGGGVFVFARAAATSSAIATLSTRGRACG